MFSLFFSEFSLTEKCSYMFIEFIGRKRDQLIHLNPHNKQKMSQFGGIGAFISVLMPMSGSDTVENKIQN